MHNTKSALLIRAWILVTALSAMVFAIPNQPHPDYNLETIPLQLNNNDWEPLVMGMATLANGDILVVTSTDLSRGGDYLTSPSNSSQVFLVSNLGGNINQATVQQVATGFFGLSGVVVANNRVFVSDRDALYELLNTDGDPAFEQKNHVIDWPGAPTWHQWAFTPMYYNGDFYVPWSGTIIPGGPSYTAATHAMSGGFLKFDINGNNLEVFSSGLRSPNGSGVSPTGIMMVADNQGSWLPSSTISHMRQGKSNGHVHQPPTAIDLWEYAPPTAWLPHNDVSRSPSEPIYMTQGPFQGQWVFGDINHEGLMRMFVEDVAGDLQGAVFPFSRGMNASGQSAAVNRLVWGPDNALYIGADGRIAGNWSSTDVTFPLYKFKHQGTTAFEILAVRSKNNGFELEFTEPVNTSQQGSWSFTVRQWTYTRQDGYGVGKTGDENRTVSSTQISADRRRVMLVINGLKDVSDGTTDVHGRSNGFVTYISANGIQSATGDSPWNTEVWYTLNNISPESFDPSVSLGQPVAWHNDINVQSGAGQYSVVLNEGGSYSVILRNLRGQTLQSHAVSGSGVHTFDKPQNQRGLFIVEIVRGTDSHTRKVLF